MKAQRVLISGILMALAMFVAACGGSGGLGSTGGNASGAASTSTPAAAPGAHKVTVNPGDTSLCDIISVEDFSQALGVSVSQLHLTAGATTMPNGVTVVTCNFGPNAGPGAGGAIDYAISNNGQAYYNAVNQEEQSQWTSANMLTGVGDAATWGTDSTANDIFNLNMLKDNVVVGISMDGHVVDGSVYLPAAEQLAKKIASKL